MDEHPDRPAKSLANDILDVLVTRVECIPIQIPFKSPVRLAGGTPQPVAEIVLVAMHTNAGFIGVGETQAFRRQGSVETLVSITEIITKHLAAVVLNRSPFELPALMKSLDETIDHSLYAKAAISDALYDLQGKILGVPVYFLLGGKARAAINACAILALSSSPHDVLSSAQRAFDAGFRDFGVKVGLGLKTDIRNISAIRERFPSVTLRIDANGSLQFDEALKLLKELEPFDIDSAEQPLASWDLKGMSELSKRSRIAIGADESVSSAHDLLKVIHCRAATVLQTKAAKNGGIWFTRNLWTIARAAGMRIYPGNHAATSLGTASVVQLAASWPDALLPGPFAAGLADYLVTDIALDPLRIEGGCVLVPEAPGLGVTLDWQKVGSLRVDRN